MKVEISEDAGFGTLAIAVSPMWHQAILRLAASMERVQGQMDALFCESSGAGFVQKTRDVAEALIDFLDSIEAYDEREQDECFEPVLGWQECRAGKGPTFDCGDDREDDAYDNEPSLGSVVGAWGSQVRWADGNQQDLEDEHDGTEPEIDEIDEADNEPSLGWTIDGNCIGPTDDREQPGYLTEADVAKARQRGPSQNPGVSVDRSLGYHTEISGITAQQMKKIGRLVVRPYR